MCCEPSGWKEEDIDGECPECGMSTCDGEAFDVCGYSPVECEVCGSAPCDLSC